MMDKEHQTQLDEEEFLLKLEQDEETENLRKVWNFCCPCSFKAKKVADPVGWGGSNLT